MKAEEKTVGQTLTDQLRYEVPAYQRPYSWEAANVEQLLEDITYSYESHDPEYFIGSLITIERHANTLYEIVDGQQRLTTLTIILSRLRDHILDAGAKVELGNRVLPTNALTGKAQTPRLQLRKQDQTFFREVILEAQAPNESSSEKLDFAKGNLLRNAKTVDAFLVDKSQQWMKLFANYILQNVFIVSVKTESFESAYRLFSVLNDRGVPLSNADLVKNHLFGRLAAADEEAANLEELWGELEAIVGAEELDTFLSYHRTSLTAEKARMTVSEEYEALFKKLSPTPVGFVKSLISSAQNYQRINEADFTSAGTLRALAALERATFDEWVPVLLAFLNVNPPDVDEANFFELLERITMQSWVRRLSRTRRNSIYYRAIRSLNSKEGVAALDAVFVESSNNDEFLSLLAGDVYGLPSCLAALMRLEESMQDDSVTKSYSGSITIEHILPQNMRDPYWKARFTEANHEQWLHKLGNLTLLSGHKNKSAQCSDFPKKKEAYEKKNLKVSFDLTKEVCALDDWKLTDLEDRHKRLLKKAAEIWLIHP